MNISSSYMNFEQVGMSLEQQRALLLMSVGSGPVNPDLIRAKESVSSTMPSTQGKQLDLYA